MPIEHDPDAPSKRTQTTERKLRAVKEGEAKRGDWRDAVPREGPLEVIAAKALERYLCNFNVTVDERTDGWFRRGEGMSTGELTLDLVGYFPTVSEKTFTALATRHHRDVRWEARRRVSVKICGGDVGTCIPAASFEAVNAWVNLLARPGLPADELLVYGAAWRQVVWQIKRRLMNRPTYSEIMLVLSGAQGSGKTSAVTHFASALENFYAPDAAFTMFSDGFRRKMMQSFYLVVLDEMARAKDTDIEDIKRCITAAYVQSRQMRSQNEAGFVRNASFIGCTNKSVARVLQDGTGMRRFVEMRFRDKPVDAKFRRELYAIDQKALWGCASYLDDVAPISQHAALVRDHQQTLVTDDPFDAWYAERVAETDDLRDKLLFSDAWPDFEEWCGRNSEEARGKNNFRAKLKSRVSYLGRTGRSYYAKKASLKSPGDGL